MCSIQSDISLVHYTNSAEAVASILDFGFLLIPNRRYVSFLPEHSANDHEPQEFGMTCFTEIPFEVASRHRERFGSFGIAVTEDWAMRNKAQRVIYISDSGPTRDAFQRLFEFARAEIDQEISRYPDDGCRHVVFASKNMAAVFGCSLYATMLELYDYMQTDAHSAQVEWRIVQQLPFKWDAPDRKQLIGKVLQFAQTFGNPRAQHVRASVLVLPSDITGLICPFDQADALRGRLPTAFSKVQIIESKVSH